MPSSTPFILQNVPADWGIPKRKLTLSWVGYKGRPLGDVEACNTVSIGFVSALDAFEVAVALPVLLADMSTPWTGLRGVAGLDFSDSYAFSLSYMIQGMPKEAVGDAVDLADASLAPFTLTLSEVFEPFNGDICIETLSKLDDFIAYHPHPSSHVIPLLPTKLLEFKPSLTSGDDISKLLELPPSLLKHELPSGNVLPIIRLFQNVAPTGYGDGDLGAVDVDAHPIRFDGWLERSLGEDGEESE